jgi:hypothetical protein
MSSGSVSISTAIKLYVGDTSPQYFVSSVIPVLSASCIDKSSFAGSNSFSGSRSLSTSTPAASEAVTVSPVIFA